MNKLRELRLKKGLKQTEVAQKIGISFQALSHYENGIRGMDNELLHKFADFYGVTIDYLLGREDEIAQKHGAGKIRRLPVIAKICAGYDGLAVEDPTGFIQEVPDAIVRGYSDDELLVFYVSGNSMYPQFLEGDHILVHRQTSVDSGDVAVVLYGGNEATIKQVVYRKGEDWFELIPRNPEYPVKRIEGADLESCQVIGKVIYLFRKI